jgi:MFS family permease
MNRSRRSNSVASGTMEQPVPASAWSPLREPLFRTLWIAAVASNVGIWMQEIAAAWLMTSLTSSPMMVALMQTATSLPIVLLALPAGALADIVDRRRLLLFTIGWMLSASALLGILTLAGLSTPWLLLSLVFIIGLGAAMTGPAWLAITPEVVSPDKLPAAVVLVGVGPNLARVVGPTLGGVIVAATGSGTIFLLNAFACLGGVIALYRWQRMPRQSLLPAERLLGAIRAGLRYVRHAPALRAVLVRTGVFMICGSALFALLPLRARRELGLDAIGYGLLLGSLGLGTVAGAAILSKVREKTTADWLVASATLLFAAGTAIFARVQNVVLLGAVMFFGGIAWIALISTFNLAAQATFPSWVRARALSVYLLVFFGGLAGGSALWGAVAARAGIPMALTYAAAGMVLGLTATFHFRLTSAQGVNLEPSLHWAAPVVTQELDPERGSVLVNVEYRIDPARSPDFEAAMRPVCHLLRRDGAFFWGLFNDTADPGRYIEFYLVESWAEHLRQHERVTFADREIEEKAEAFHIGDRPPLISHLIARDQTK